MSQQDPAVSKAVTVSDMQQLLKKKDEIEAQIKAYYEVLEDNEPLVDVEGYPCADADVYQVWTARHNISCCVKITSLMASPDSQCEGLRAEFRLGS